jgi:8-oxo-dGTP pyrophosphatase MutT (NUDIX family)
VFFGETLVQALQRHLHATLHDASVTLDIDLQPHFIFQWFPTRVAPTNGTPHGDDPRKHAVALCFALDITGNPSAVVGGEATEFRWFSPSDLPTDFWPGSRGVVERLLKAQERS